MGTRASGAFFRFRPYERALFARQVVVTALPVACYILRLDVPAVRPILHLAVAATALNFLYYLLHIKGRFPQALRWGRLVVDIVLWTFLLHYTGGPGSIFFLGYLVEVLISAIAVSGAGCLGGAIISSCAYLVLLLREPHLLSWEQSLSRLLTLLLAGVLCQVLIRRLETRGREESEELRRRLARAEALGRLGEAAAGMVHEVRNTVHGLRGFLSLLKEDLGSDSRGTSQVNLIESGVKRMHDVADGLLAQSKAQLQERSLVDVQDVIREAVALATEGEKAKGVEISIEEEASFRVLANQEALRGVFVNLVRNALQAMQGGGRLLIRISQDGPDMVRLDCTDSGPGIPPAIQHRIFEPLFTTRADGAGLGLWISRRTLEDFGGRLSLTRTGAEGTTMTALLPIHRPRPAREKVARSMQDPVARSAHGR